VWAPVYYGHISSYHMKCVLADFYHMRCVLASYEMCVPKYTALACQYVLTTLTLNLNLFTIYLHVQAS
jgi:hypothetical protein